MTGTKGKLEFHVGEDDWELYTERLELYFVANDIEDEKQVAVLLTKISPETYKLVTNLCAPNKPKDKTFNELVKLVKDHLCPKPSEAMESYSSGSGREKRQPTNYNYRRRQTRRCIQSRKGKGGEQAKRTEAAIKEGAEVEANEDPETANKYRTNSSRQCRRGHAIIAEGRIISRGTVSTDTKRAPDVKSEGILSRLAERSRAACSRWKQRTTKATKAS
ncbi:hypothetical protein RF55_17561 [Lasius niger]|uniref:Uncharacterized protein n=1 Tax=Lasius niger TaxID=67767 RepID=A0A0J7K287_LASNI|nr:hypothetical protein RF55_17561 [Lasius niger]